MHWQFARNWGDINVCKKQLLTFYSNILYTVYMWVFHDLAQLEYVTCGLLAVEKPKCMLRSAMASAS
jgi:hypothetical protein